uniref:Radical SAM protein n=1 Tax=Ignisphaera aggregans TaxID=334771 RepID=A0A7C5TG76_9CREN
MITLFETSTRDWVIRLSLESHPDELVVEVSSICNMDCLHCFRKAAQDLEPRQIDLNLFESLVVEALESGVKKVVFSGWGEPLIHPSIDRMVGMCKELGLSIALNTNGVLLYKFTNLVLNYVDELFLSLDAASAKTYSSIRSAPVFNSIIYSLKEILRVKQLRGFLKPRIIALYTVTKLNIEDIDLFLELAKGLGVNEAVFSFSIPFNNDSFNCLSSIECLESFYTKFREAEAKFKELGFSIATPPRPYTPNVKCPFAANRALFIRSDGAVTPCIYYAYSWTTTIFGLKRSLKAVILGYIGKDRLIDIWRNRYSKIFYRLGLRKSVPSCLTCTLAEYCMKTRSNEVDCLGGQPNCGHCPFYHGLTFCPL